jgi:hypothetical protein
LHVPLFRKIPSPGHKPEEESEACEETAAKPASAIGSAEDPPEEIPEGGQEHQKHAKAENEFHDDAPLTRVEWCVLS